MAFLCTVRPSPDDARDLILTNRDCPVSPLQIDWRPFLLPVRNQGAQGSCMAHAAATMKFFQEVLDYGLDEALSPQFIYDARSNIRDDNPSNDNGMCSRDAMKILYHQC